MMQQLLYKNAQTALKSELTHLQNRLIDANGDLGKFKDPQLSVHDKNELLATLGTHDIVLAKKVAMCNNKLPKL